MNYMFLLIVFKNKFEVKDKKDKYNYYLFNLPSDYTIKI